MNVKITITDPAIPGSWPDPDFGVAGCATLAEAEALLRAVWAVAGAKAAERKAEMERRQVDREAQRARDALLLRIAQEIRGRLRMRLPFGATWRQLAPRKRADIERACALLGMEPDPQHSVGRAWTMLIEGLADRVRAGGEVLGISSAAGGAS